MAFKIDLARLVEGATLTAIGLLQGRPTGEETLMPLGGGSITRAQLPALTEEGLGAIVKKKGKSKSKRKKRKKGM